MACTIMTAVPNQADGKETVIDTNMPAVPTARERVFDPGRYLARPV